jgi:hypothetical protein
VGEEGRGRIGPRDRSDFRSDRELDRKFSVGARICNGLKLSTAKNLPETKSRCPGLGSVQKLVPTRNFWCKPRLGPEPNRATPKTCQRHL